MRREKTGFKIHKLSDVNIMQLTDHFSFLCVENKLDKVEAQILQRVIEKLYKSQNSENVSIKNN